MAVLHARRRWPQLLGVHCVGQAGLIGCMNQQRGPGAQLPVPDEYLVLLMCSAQRQS